jgi:membrane fusion protein (multidrug efflux system)
MKKRLAITLAIVIVFIAIIGSVKYFQIRSAMAQQGSFQPPPEAVTTVVAAEAEWNTTLHAIGSVEAVHGVTVSADLPGLIEAISFDSGRAVNKGDVLIQLDARQERAQLAAAESQREVSRLDLRRAEAMLGQKIIPQSTYDSVKAQFQQADAKVGEIRATIERKIIRAPFSGVLGIRQVNLGEYLAGGAPIVSLQAMRPAYVNFTVPQQEIGRLATGTAVEVTSDALPAPENGHVSALDATIDAATRNIHVQAVFDNASGRLRPGMFVEARLARSAHLNIIPLPASAISYAPFGDSVFIVEQMKEIGPDGKPTGKMYRGVRQQFVKLGGSRGDQVAIVSGVKPGEEVVTSGVFKLRPGAAVLVNNAVQPANSTAPKPEDS